MEAEKVAWAYGFKTARKWLTGVRARNTGSTYTERAYASALFKFCDWRKKNPDELITMHIEEVRTSGTETPTEDKLEEFCVMMEEAGKAKGKKGIKTTVVTRLHAPIKSFYRYNKTPLNMVTPRYATQPRQPHTTEQIKKLMQVANIRERAIIMFLKDSGISREDVIELIYGDIQDEYEHNRDVIHVQLIRQKAKVKYETFIGKEATEHLRTYLEYRARQGEKITKETRLFATLGGKPLTAQNLSVLFDRLGEKVGFKTSPHRFRKFFESCLGLAAPSILVKYWMGHTLGIEGHYFIPPPEKQREHYAQAYHEIEIFRTEVSEIERRKQQIRDSIALMVASGQLSQEKAEGITNNLQNVKSVQELEEGLRNEMRFYRTKEKDCTNGNCQKVIEETELTALLQQGWRFVATLPSGKVVVTNE
jgi:integrase